MGLYFPFLATDRLRGRDDRAERDVDAGARRDSRTSGDSRTSDDSTAHGAVSRDGSPLATIVLRGQVLRIVRVNAEAAAAGIREGQTLADAKARVPELGTDEDDPAEDRRTLEALAAWAFRFSPAVFVYDEDTLIVDVTGCEALFDGEENLLRLALGDLAEQGFGARGAIADTAGAAWALTHASSEPAIVAERGQAAAYVAPLPVWALRADASIPRALTTLGVHTVGDLWHLPRSSLATRFGEALLERIDQVLGETPEVLTPYQPEPTLEVRIPFGAASDRREVLQEAIALAAERFCGKLERRSAGVCQVFVTYSCLRGSQGDVGCEKGFSHQRASVPHPRRSEDGAPNAGKDSRRSGCENGFSHQRRVVTKFVRFSRPTRSAEHVRKLLTAMLDGLRLPSPAYAVTLWTREFASLTEQQGELFEEGVRETARELADLVDRLAVRLGADAVVRAEAVEDHQPERAFRYETLVGGRKGRRDKGTGGGRDIGTQGCRDGATKRRSDKEGERDGRAKGDSVSARLLIDDRTSLPVAAVYRPLQVFPCPLEILATAIVPDGPPISFRCKGDIHTIVHCEGPERIETGWWRGMHVMRDYYRVMTASGRRAWLFRDRSKGRWFLHGWFD